MIRELNDSHVWKNNSKMGYDGFEYSCSPFYAHGFNRISRKS